MNAVLRQPSIHDELAAAAAQSLATGDLLAPPAIDRQLAIFREYFLLPRYYSRSTESRFCG